MTDDHDLRDRFAALRRDIEARAPSFEAVLRRAAHTPRERSGVWRVAGAALMFAFVAVTLLIWFSRAPAPGISVSAAPLLSWQSPTDFLLDTPEQAFLRAVPRLGEFPSPLPPVNDGSPPITQQLSSLSENAS